MIGTQANAADEKTSLLASYIRSVQPQIIHAKSC